MGQESRVDILSALSNVNKVIRVYDSSGISISPRRDAIRVEATSRCGVFIVIPPPSSSSLVVYIFKNTKLNILFELSIRAEQT